MFAVSGLVVACSDASVPEGRSPSPCGETCHTPVASPAPATASEPPAPDVSPATAEASAVAALVSFGTPPDALAGHHVGRVLARDWDGQPFVYLVFTASDARIRDPLSFPDASAVQAGNASTVVMGASTTRGEAAFVARDLDMLAALQTSIAAAGGRAHVDAIVAASPTELLVRSTDGRLFLAGQTQPIAPALEEKLRSDWAATNAAPEAATARAASQEAWLFHDRGDDTVARRDVPRGTLADVTLPDGNLDLPRALAMVDLAPFASAVTTHLVDARAVETAAAARRGFASPSQEGCWGYWFFGWHTVCDAVEQGGFSRPDVQQAHREIQSRGYRVPTCGPLKTRWQSAGVDTDALAGCGPASMTSLIWRAWLDGEPFASLGDMSRQTAARYDAWSYDGGFEQRVSGPLIEDMGACSDGPRGTSTYHWDFVNGANAWLGRNGSTYRMRNVWSLPPAHGLDASRKADALHQRIGLQEKPMVVALDIDVGSHFAPIAAYRIVRHANPLRGTDVFVRGFDEGQSTERWYAISNPWSLASALYWLER